MGHRVKICTSMPRALRCLPYEEAKVNLELGIFELQFVDDDHLVTAVELINKSQKRLL